MIIVSDEDLVSNFMSDKEVGKVLINFTRTKGLFNAESIVKVASEKDLAVEKGLPSVDSLTKRQLNILKLLKK